MNAQVSSGAVPFDAGCGRSAAVLTEYLGKPLRLIGIEIMPFSALISRAERTLVAKLVCNRFHVAALKRVQGRPEEDTFRTAQGMSARGEVEKLGRWRGFALESFECISRYRNYLLLNALLLFLGLGFEEGSAEDLMLRVLRGWIW